MAERIRITETDLRYFMRDRRYWQAGHPERQGYVAWVTDGFRTLFGSSDGAGSGAVWVKPYSRTRNGHTEQVAGHWRAPPPTTEGAIPVQDRGSTPPHHGQRVPGPQDPVGRSGAPIRVRPGTNQPEVIQGRRYSNHALDQMQGRGVTPSAVENAVRPEHYVGANGGYRLYWDSSNRLMVVIDPKSNTVVTAITRSRPPRIGRTTP